MINQKDIIEYYDKSKVAYQDVWHLDSSMALHYGFWEKGVRNLKQALIKENEVLANIIQIQSTDTVLDAGCGVGGSSIYLAKTFKCQVHGITLSDDQVNTANKLAQQHGVEDKVKFSIGDFHKTDFEDNSFDVIWFVESFCHTYDPLIALREAYRILKPNGRLIIADAFLVNQENSEEDSLLLKNWLNNWAVKEIPDLLSMGKSLEHAGFYVTQLLDYSSKVTRSSFLLYFYAKLALGFGKLRRAVGKTYGNEVTIKNTLGAKYQYKAFKKKLWKYQVITAFKN